MKWSAVFFKKWLLFFFPQNILAPSQKGAQGIRATVTIKIPGGGLSTRSFSFSVIYGGAIGKIHTEDVNRLYRYLDSDDGWDSDVILHEYAHHVLSRFYGDAPILFACPGFVHGFAMHTSDSCAWSEGWTTFLQAAIQNAEIYLDTKYPVQGNNVFAEIESADLAPLDPQHPDSSDDESAVMAALWDIFDNSGGSETFDLLALGINNPANNGIWTLSTGLDSTPQNKATIEDFWEAWDTSGNGNECGGAAILRHDQIPLGPLPYELTISVSPAGSGTVSLSPQADCPEGKYSEGTSVTLTANANPGYAFFRWTGGASGSSNPTSVIMNADKQITANFKTATLTPTPTPTKTPTLTPTPTSLPDLWLWPGFGALLPHPTEASFTVSGNYLVAADDAGYTSGGWYMPGVSYGPEDRVYVAGYYVCASPTCGPLSPEPPTRWHK